MWDERYSVDEYVYGTEPNSFLASNANLLEGPVLSLAEGEGRNAVYLASLGLEVHGVDGSKVGLAKARALAATKGVKITTEVVDLSNYSPAHGVYRSIVYIFAHLPSAIRRNLYPLLERTLPTGGIILMEAYSEAQLKLETGGPKDLDMLMSAEKISRELPGFEPIVLREIDREVNEGTFHNGLASVVQFIGRKIAIRS